MKSALFWSGGKDSLLALTAHNKRVWISVIL